MGGRRGQTIPQDTKTALPFGAASCAALRYFLPMRSPALALVTSLAIATATSFAACGGEPKTPVTPKADDSSSVADAGAATGDPGPTTTTTTTLGDGGDLQGAKLTSTTSTTVPTASSAPDPKGPAEPHTPDPGRSRDDLIAIIKAHRTEARACYDDEKKKKNGQISEGDLVIDWIIDPDGNPTKVALNTGKSQITEPAVVNCVIEVIKKIKFSKSPRGFQTTTWYPFNFKKNSKPQ
jgi:hypothetical protein